MSKVFINSGNFNIDVKSLKRFAEEILKIESAPPNLRIEITLTDDVFIKRLNKRYLGRNYATDCLCFNLSDEIRRINIADVYISYDRALEQAKERDETIDFELAMLTAHGVLHAIGYEDDEEIMKRQEDYIKRLFKLSK